MYNADVLNVVLKEGGRSGNHQVEGAPILFVEGRSNEMVDLMSRRKVPRHLRFARGELRWRGAVWLPSQSSFFRGALPITNKIFYK